MSRVVGLYLIGTFLAALTAVAASFLFPVNITLAAAAAGYEAASGIGAVLESLLMKVVENPVGALINANYIGILAWAAVFGVALRRAGEATKRAVWPHSRRADPGGALDHCLCSRRYSGTCVQCGVGKWAWDLYRVWPAAAAFGGLYAVHCSGGQSADRVLQYAEKPLSACVEMFERERDYRLFTRSSAANIPVNMELCKN